MLQRLLEFFFLTFGAFVAFVAFEAFAAFFMNLRQYLFVMFFATVLCWISWSMVIVNIDPKQGSFIGLAFFYVSIFFALIGTLSIASFAGYRLFSRSGLPTFRYVKKSFRNGLFFSSILTGLLYMQIQHMLNLWNFTLFLLAVALLVSFSVSAKQSPHEGENN